MRCVHLLLELRFTKFVNVKSMCLHRHCFCTCIVNSHFILLRHLYCQLPLHCNTRNTQIVLKSVVVSIDVKINITIIVRTKSTRVLSWGTTTGCSRRPRVVSISPSTLKQLASRSLALVITAEQNNSIAIKHMPTNALYLSRNAIDVLMCFRSKIYLQPIYLV